MSAKASVAHVNGSTWREHPMIAANAQGDTLLGKHEPHSSVGPAGFSVVAGRRVADRCHLSQPILSLHVHGWPGSPS